MATGENPTKVEVEELLSTEGARRSRITEEYKGVLQSGSRLALDNYLSATGVEPDPFVLEAFHKVTEAIVDFTFDQGVRAGELGEKFNIACTMILNVTDVRDALKPHLTDKRA